MSNFPGSRVLVCVCLAAAALGAACDRPPTTPSPPLVSPFAITSVFPGSGPHFGSTVVRISGRGFDSGSVVKIDGTVTPAVVLSASVIDVTMPAHAAGFVDISVTTPSGATATQPQAFTYLQIDPPVVTDVTPAIGAVEGYNVVTIRGAGFDVNTVVTIDGVTAHPAIGPAPTTGSLQVIAPPHAAGTADLTVTNRYGQTSRVPGGYTYATPETFDLNGVWQGEIVPHGFPGDHGAPMSMTIRNDVVVSVTCGALTHAFSPPVVVAQGRFSRSAAAGSVAGQALSPIEASGTLTIPGCSSPLGWTAFK